MNTRITNPNLLEDLQAWAALDHPETQSDIEVEEHDWDDFEHVTLQGSQEREPIRKRDRQPPTIEEYKASLPDYNASPVHKATRAEIRAYQRDPERFANRSVRGAK